MYEHFPERALLPSWPIKGWSSRCHIEITCGYLVAYVALDWLSYVHPFDAFGITPWSPPTGLSFALIIVLAGSIAILRMNRRYRT